MSISSPRDEASVAQREQLYGDATRAASLGMGVNGLLVLIKLVGGVLTGSAALIADAVNSIGDLASALAVRSALGVAQAEEDEDHPYGHTKAESIAGLCVSLLVAFSAGVLAMETLKRLGQVHTPPSVVAGIIAAVCGLMKEAMYHYSIRVANRIDSSAIRAAAWDHRSDALASGLVAVSLLTAPYLGRLGPYVDPVAALLLCAVLIYTGLKIFLRTARELMDQQADEEMIQRVRTLASHVPGVADVEKLRVRKSGIEYFIEIHIEVDGNLTVDQGHRIGHAVKDELLSRLPRVRDVHVHIEPYHATPVVSAENDQTFPTSTSQPHQAEPHQAEPHQTEPG